MVCKDDADLHGADLYGAFQSLLCWIMVCKDKRYQAHIFGLDLFQSLLCWIMVCKVFRSAPMALALPVSILVMLDYGL